MPQSIHEVVSRHEIKRQKSKTKSAGKQSSQSKSGTKENHNATFRLRKIVISWRQNFTPLVKTDT